MYNDYDYSVPRNPVGYGLLSLVCGVIGMVIAFLTSSGLTLAAVALGAIGMVVGGFSIGVANHFPMEERLKLMGLAAAGIMTSVIAFIFGLVYSFT